MPFNSIGDLASSLMLSQANVQAKKNLMRLSTELTTGVTTDVSGVLRNDLSPQLGWERDIASATVLDKTLTEALVKVQTRQAVLTSISDNAIAFANDLSLSLNSNVDSASSAVPSSAEGRLSQVLSELNTQFAGGWLFSGTSSNAPSVAPAGDIISAIKTIVTGASTASEVEARVQNWMDDPVSGYDTFAYLGSDQQPSPLRLSGERTLCENTKANDPAIKQTVQNLMLAVISTDAALGIPSDSRSSLLISASEGLRSAESKLTIMRANLGFVESELTKEKVQVGAEIATAEMLRAKMLSVDPYETASKLQAAELQLEKIYTVTARSAQMSLLEYL
jgi:flagellar hook-associated protein 3 FlgL